ncbi:histidine phosphatase family protein [Rhizobacter sp. AJA081-3]|uniref:histidine phosphatase family protein n=1 Tax=Rhizobacter sp. AJA081-3 TaxID=2753607 RepID=UPI001AE0B208|nr:histidine phosphatase family protein [Rhizobacter sp. AJA081-3]QTN22973.1 histidine phosphatase family protein [Rhizobacter sp. AJA081-3]
MKRRVVLAGLGLPWLGLPSVDRAEAAPAVDAAAALRRGGVAVLLRHAATEPGIGDPPGFRLDDCATQRQLSEQGRAQSQRIGAWFSARSLVPAEVRSSAWCRCLDTATLAFGRGRAWAPLNSFFGDRSVEPGQSAELRAALGKLPAQGFEVWVTHQVNISALTGVSPGMGEAVVVRLSGGKVHNLARIRFED